MDQEKNSITIAVSSCLLGKNVRYDGSHKLCNQVIALKNQGFQLIGICPEFKLGVPRPPIQMLRKNKSIQLIGVYDKNFDATQVIEQFFMESVNLWKSIDGLILKSKSPSCGLIDALLFDQNNQLINSSSSGLFAQKIKGFYPRLPLIDENQFTNKKNRDAFIFATKAYAQNKQLK